VETLLVAKRDRPLLEVTLIVPAGTWTPTELTYDAQQHHYAAYIDAGMEVFEYQNHFSHLDRNSGGCGPRRSSADLRPSHERLRSMRGTCLWRATEGVVIALIS